MCLIVHILKENLVSVSAAGPNKICKIEGRYGSQQFAKLVEENILPHLDGGATRNFIVDQFPVHKCEAVKQWFARQTGLSLLILPPNSGDLMPVGSIADIIIKKLNSVPVDVSSTDELIRQVFESFSTVCNTANFKDTVMSISDVVKKNCESNDN